MTPIAHLPPIRIRVAGRDGQQGLQLTTHRSLPAKAYGQGAWIFLPFDPQHEDPAMGAKVLRVDLDHALLSLAWMFDQNAPEVFPDA